MNLQFRLNNHRLKVTQASKESHTPIILMIQIKHWSLLALNCLILILVFELFHCFRLENTEHFIIRIVKAKTDIIVAILCVQSVVFV